MKTRRTHSEMLSYHTYVDRLNYLRLNGEVGIATFGFDRYLNQRFYTSYEWRSIRSFVIARDQGYDLGVRGLEVPRGLLIHHLNPISVDDLKNADESILDPENLVVTSLTTHNHIHYGTKPRDEPAPRKAGDTKLW